MLQCGSKQANDEEGNTMQNSYFTKLSDGKWGVTIRGDLGGKAAHMAGQAVEVRKADGTTKTVNLGARLDVWNGGRAATYAIASSGKPAARPTVEVRKAQPAPTGAPIVTARFKGWCARCGLQIHKGNEVTKAVGQRSYPGDWMHARHLPTHPNYDPDTVLTLTYSPDKPGLRDRDYEPKKLSEAVNDGRRTAYVADGDTGRGKYVFVDEEAAAEMEAEARVIAREEADYQRGYNEVADIQAITAPGSALREQMYLDMERNAYNRGEEG